MEVSRRYRVVDFDPAGGVVVVWDVEEKKFMRVTVAAIETWRVPSMRNKTPKKVAVPVAVDQRQTSLPIPVATAQAVAEAAMMSASDFQADPEAGEFGTR